ncbi:sulfotransferase family 2 domain-containing protein [Microbulbifer agarilyticus]|uniref:sulfotransferase family 2 domain-containing protein n=1 Tax=Microbulbifer agarilyticus TaxID=260552 RepID=UPI001CD39FC2|nr:sulfotransferase family 2 domain-containing protein [Microbulbifer agarilyticus]MCA0893710.1 sulfotransferase family protein [Microbulbifer agarilyticus]
MRVLICGLSKTGTTYLAEKVKRSLESFLGREVQEVFEPKNIEHTGGGLLYKHKAYQKISKSDEVVKILSDSGPSADTIISTQKYFDKKIMIVRDPRDRLISGTFYRWHKGHNPDPEKFERCLRLTKHKENYPDDIPFMFLYNQNPVFFSPGRADFGRSYRSAIKLMNDLDSDWHIVKYEDVVDEKLDGLGKYLGFSVVDNVSVSEGRSRVARSKSYGNWRNWFTSADVSYFKPVFKQYMEKNGYDFSDWKLNQVSELPSKEGSDYMLRIYGEELKETLSINRTLQKKFLALKSLATRAAMKVTRSSLSYKLFPRVPASKPYFFVHLPKTGGTSFREALAIRIGNDNIVEDYRGHRDYKNSIVFEYIEKQNDFAGFSMQLSRLRNPWLVGHTDLERYSDLFEPKQVVTFVRHPVERIVSSYRHKIRKNRISCSFEEYCQKHVNDNFQSRKLRGLELSDIGFVGVTDRYEESIRCFNSMSGLNLPVLKANQAPMVVDFDISKNLYEELCEANSLDLRLYEEANALLDLKLKAANQ